MTITKRVRQLQDAYLLAGYLGAELEPKPATSEEIKTFEKLSGIAIPNELIELYKCGNGQIGKGNGFFGEFYFCSLSTSSELYQMFKEIILDEEDCVEDFVENYGEKYYSKYFITIGTCNTFYLCVHSQTLEVWLHDPSGGANFKFKTLDSMFQHLIGELEGNGTPAIFESNVPTEPQKELTPEQKGVQSQLNNLMATLITGTDQHAALAVLQEQANRALLAVYPNADEKLQKK